MKFKEWLYQLFYFNKQERNGVFVLSILIALLLVIKCSMSLWVSPKESFMMAVIPTKNKDVSKEKTLLDFNQQNKQFKNEKTQDVELFVFNPNTICVEDAQRLGFSKKLSTTLINFRNKGGKFYKPEDLKKLFGVSPQLYDQLEDYILIPATNKEYKRDSFNYQSRNSNQVTKKPKEIIEINSADSLSIVYLKGVGPAFTKRIIKYRSMLGGFHNINQLREVYGMTDSLFLNVQSQIQVDKTQIIKIPINAIDFNSLRKHPYFSYASAQAIINFKFKHGKLTEQDLKSLGVFSEEKLALILPYIEY